MPTKKQRKMPLGRTTKALQFLAEVLKWSDLKDLLFASLCSKTCHKFTPFPCRKKTKKLTQKWLRCHCQRCTALPILCPTNSSHAAWIRLPWTLAIQLGSTLMYRSTRNYADKLHTPKQAQSLYRDFFFTKEKSMQMSPGQFRRGHLSTNMCQSFLKSICCLFSTSGNQFNVSKNLHWNFWWQKPG